MLGRICLAQTMGDTQQPQSSEEPVTISLRELTADNWDQCLDLEVTEAQKEFVADNLYSIAEAQFYPGTICHAIYADETMVGFAMYGPDQGYSPEQERDSAYAIVRLMIDKSHQGRGYGRAAMELLIRHIQKVQNCGAIYLSSAPENRAAERLYRSLGFEATGEVHDGEVVFRLRLIPDRDEQTRAESGVV